MILVSAKWKQLLQSYLITEFRIRKIIYLAEMHKLTLNLQKTYYMVFHRSRINTDTHAVITMDNVCLQRTDSFKYLGVIINQ